MITLKDFVKETLTQITDAIVEFSDERRETGANANPPLSNSFAQSDAFSIGPKFDQDKQRFETVMPVHFDVAVTAQDTTAEGGKAGIQVLSFLKAEGGLEKETVSSSVSRVAFKVPLGLPETGGRGPRNTRPAQRRVVRS